MSKQVSWSGLLLIGALFLSGAAGAVEPQASLAPVPPAGGCLQSTPANAGDLPGSFLTPAVEKGTTACGPGCGAIGQGTDLSCRGKMVGDSCGFTGGSCFIALTPTCPHPNDRCICTPR
jgi:hypothetical protein